MRFLLGKGEISFFNLCAAFFFAKSTSLFAFFALRNYFPKDVNSSIFISRSLELSLFLLLITANFLPRKFPFAALFRIPTLATKRNIAPQILVIIITVIISRYAMELLVVIPSLFLEPTINQLEAPGQSSFDRAPLATLFTGKILAQITIVPFVEEIIYRGILVNFLLSRYTTIISVIVSSLIFSILHGNPFTAFLGGLVFAYVYIFTKNIWLCVLSHSIANITVVLMNRFGEYIYPSLSNSTNNARLSIWICSIIGLTWVVGLLATMIRYRKINYQSIFPTDLARHRCGERRNVQIAEHD
jgi:membrane protease YdiL (CAAX protease family)